MAYRLFEQSKEDIHEDGVWTVAWSNKNNLVMTGSVDSTVKVWKGDSMSKPLFKFTGHRLGVISVDISKDGKCKFFYFL